MQKLKVLFADDEPSIRMLMENIFEVVEIPGAEDVAIDATIVDDGSAAVEKAREQKYDVLITDVRMPIMDGMQAAREIRRMHPDTYIIFATAFVDENMAEMTELGNHVVKKPYSYIHVQDGLGSYFKRERMVAAG